MRVKFETGSARATLKGPAFDLIGFERMTGVETLTSSTRRPLTTPSKPTSTTGGCLSLVY